MDGIFVVDKPSGITSYQVVREVKKILGIKKVGHGGTLDPLATGVLPLFLNRATKLANFLMKDTKKYRATMKLGSTTDTQDREGRILTKSNHMPTDSQIIKVLHSFKGEISQTPPMFSAIKVGGKPLYKLARRGISVERRPRTIFIHSLNVLDITPPYVTFEVLCSSGTYVRTLCADSGEKLACGAHLVDLSRLQSGNFHLDDALTLDQLRVLSKDNLRHEHLFPLSKSFKNLPDFTVENSIISLLKKRRVLSVVQARNISFSRLVKGNLIKIRAPGDPCIGLVHVLIGSDELPTSQDANQALKIICFFNPYENTLH